MHGGLGNQMFQYAAARRLAHTLNTDLKINFLLPKKAYMLSSFNIQENFATPEEIAAAKLVQYHGGGGYPLSYRKYWSFPITAHCRVGWKMNAISLTSLI